VRPVTGRGRGNERELRSGSFDAAKARGPAPEPAGLLAGCLKLRATGGQLGLIQRTGSGQRPGPRIWVLRPARPYSVLRNTE